WTIAIVAAAAALGVRRLVGPHAPIPLAAAVLIPYGIIYLGGTSLLKMPEARSLGSLLARFTSKG
ncbi:MAG TPA: hypothetical protein VEJ39_00800, partial [Candidatus Acidoferrales bacterium]|nr:hypothetical protein [Candidatus Acidoferrales bacterium]